MSTTPYSTVSQLTPTRCFLFSHIYFLFSAFFAPSSLSLRPPSAPQSWPNHPRSLPPNYFLLNPLRRPPNYYPKSKPPSSLGSPRQHKSQTQRPCPIPRRKFFIHVRTETSTSRAAQKFLIPSPDLSTQ